MNGLFGPPPSLSGILTEFEDETPAEYLGPNWREIWLDMTPAERRAYLAVLRHRRKELTEYRDDPVGYGRDVLGLTWWSAQEQIAESVRDHAVTAVESGNGIGKSNVAAALIRWWYDTRDPSICLTTAPTATSVEKILWGELRMLRPWPNGLAPKAPYLGDSPMHYAHGFTAKSEHAFHGRHGVSVFIIVDEAVGVDPRFREPIMSMLQGPECRLLVLCNPTDAASWVYELGEGVTR